MIGESLGRVELTAEELATRKARGEEWIDRFGDCRDQWEMFLSEYWIETGDEDAIALVLAFREWIEQLPARLEPRRSKRNARAGYL